MLNDATGQSACSALGQAVFHYSHGSTEYIVCMAEAKTLVQVPSAELGNNLSFFFKLYRSLTLISVGCRDSGSQYQLRVTPLSPFYLKSRRI